MDKYGYTFICFLLFCLTGSPVGAQQPSMFFFGKVVDRETRQPVSSVNIRFTGTESGSSTNDKGEFSFFIDTIPVYMIVSHLGYETQRIWLDNTSSSITVMLRPQAAMLKEVEIKAVNEPLPFFKDRHYSVLDFEADSSRIYLIVYRYRLAQSELICMSYTGDTLTRSGPLAIRPKELFRDCMGNVHLLTTDSAYQIFRNSERLILLYPNEIKRFRLSLQDCVASAGDLLYFKQMSRDGMQVQFFAINRKTRKRQYLTESVDE
ncbi:MAG: carboxypeptidase-like regulatory domain-containing protein, partial [Bacteroidales bacterium]|nr:carboxypeptidase-like regulatory domain-containing protein [Bacteroidales bacterium]